MSGFFIDTTQRKNEFVSQSANNPLKHHRRDDKSQNGSSQDFNAKGNGSFISQPDSPENGINHRQTTDMPED